MAAASGLKPILKGLSFALVGLLIGAGLGLLFTSLTNRPSTEPVIVLGYVFALLGWLLGVGLWDAWGREWVGLPVQGEAGHDWRRFFRFTTDHKIIGVQYLVTFVVVMLLAGIASVLMRVELMAPGKNILGPNEFNTTMSLHGIMMIAVAVATIIGGFANFLLPLMIGADDVAFPRINALSYWIIPPVAVLLLLTPFFGGFDSGWTAYPPLSVINAHGQLLFLLAFLTFGVSSILGGLNFLTTIIKLRAPGMTWGRLPIFVWSIFAAALISLTATQFVAYGLLMIILDRVVGMSFFRASEGGNPLLYEHIFWFYSHPAVYIMILPAFGIALEVLTHFSRKPLFAYKWVVGAFLGIVGLSFIVWAHHLYTSGMPNSLHIPFMVTTELISIPTGVVFLAALGTIWMGRLWLTTPMLFAIAFVFNFLIGGVTGIFLADVPTDIQLQDNYFVVAHFHYTIMGGEIFAIMAGLYYWFPKVTGRMYHEKLGKVHFWSMFLTYNVTFLAMFWAGIQGMNRRVADYIPDLAGINLFVSIASFFLAASFLILVYNLVRSWARGTVASASPWRARTLEWQTSSPPPLENFPHPPVVVGHPYDYGVPGSVHAAPAPVGGGSEDER
ncbi:MAG: cbb3-type cytochrome c oxidase subunit I [Chloroflexi bacterium]|nr:cbb3-type cytochrome c oxidase subunit I [Chloroflexota bacterium]